MAKGAPEETYSAEIVTAHIHMYAQMVYLANNWSCVLCPKSVEAFKEAIRKAENEFLEEFKDEGFHMYLQRIKEIMEG